MDESALRNLREWLTTAAGGEDIIAVTTADGACAEWSTVATKLNVQLTLAWGAGAPPLYAWTRSRVIFLECYDGWPRMRWVPRDPSGGAPDLGGFEAEGLHHWAVKPAS